MQRLLISCLLVLTALLPACESGGVPPAAGTTAASAPEWPASPARPRVRYLRAFGGPRELGIGKPVFERVMDGLLGRPEQRFVRPTGVAALQDVIYVADPGVPALWILDTRHGSFSQVSDAGGLALVSPVAVAVRPDGAVFVADSALKKVLLFDRSGRFLRVAAGTGLERPAGLAYLAATDALYVADSARHRIAVFDAHSVEQRSWGAAGDADGEFNYPSYLSLDRQGTLMVTDALNFRIQAFTADGGFRWRFGRNGDGGGDFAAPKGIAADSLGHVFVADALFDAVQVFERDGTFLLSFGERGGGPGQFSLPTGVFIDEADRIYVADGYNARIQMFSSLALDARQEAK